MGAVQGVGFRPFVYRLAVELGLHGWVKNSAQGVFIEVEGPRARQENFLVRLGMENPPPSSIQSLESSWLDPVGYTGFAIHESEAGGARTAWVLPDIATCPACLSEIFDPANRRFGYPFTNCTHCGPRFSIIEALPYDRANTSMKRFTQCPQCAAEYYDPGNRRFHAQPNACPVCGPSLELLDAGGGPVAGQGGAGGVLAAVANLLRTGAIVAVKGLGGFHLMVSARDEAAVQSLRRRKHREEKPFALMFPSMDAIRAVCEVSPMEERWLRSPEAPIVLLARRPSTPEGEQLASGVAPGNPNLGAMLPANPLHHLLLRLLGFPVVATSGNLSDEPICIRDREAVERLGGIADCFLVHNRPIVRHVDDSIVRLMAGRELMLRRARGYAPLPINVSAGAAHLPTAPPTVLGVGGHLKNSVALAIGRRVFLSQHIGDLESEAAYGAFQRVIADFQRLYDVSPEVVAADRHPDYLSTRYARELAGEERPPVTPNASGCASEGHPRLVRVQHHLAHVLACMAENEIEPPALGVSWDGTGYGLDGTIWGGEFFLLTPSTWRRAASFRLFPLPGGDKAMREPRRAALGLVYAMEGERALTDGDSVARGAFTGAELTTLGTMLRKGLHAPLTSSVGRLFDAVASLTGLRQEGRFDGQAAMELELATAGGDTAGHYPIPLEHSPAPPGGPEPHAEAPLRLEWQPMVQALREDRGNGVPRGVIAARFHNGLVEAILAVARHCQQERVLLSGGCFQNRYLTERAVRRLGEEGFRPYWHQRVPPNDGGIALGQIAAARRGWGAG